MARSTTTAGGVSGGGSATGTAAGASIVGAAGGGVAVWISGGAVLADGLGGCSTGIGGPGTPGVAATTVNGAGGASTVSSTVMNSGSGIRSGPGSAMNPANSAACSASDNVTGHRIPLRFLSWDCPFTFVTKSGQTAIPGRTATGDALGTDRGGGPPPQSAEPVPRTSR